MLPPKNKVEHRRFIRHPMCFPLSYRVIKKGMAGSVKGNRSVTENVSRGGMLFSATHPVEKRSHILIKIPFQDKIFRVQAKVIHCKKTSDTTELYDIGVQFIKISEAFKVRLIEQMYLISEYRDLNSVRLGREISLQEASQEWVKKYSKRFEKLYW